MQIQALQTVQEFGWIPAYDWWADHQVDHSSCFLASADWVETVPTMPSTVLGLELLLQDQSLDLQMASDLILRDVGATLQIMRLMSLELPYPESGPFRMATCLATLDTASWFAALSTNTMSYSTTPNELSGLWKHSRSVAQFAKLIAESLGEVSPEDAYLAGLMHEVEHIGLLLGKYSHAGTTQGPRLNQILSGSVMAALQSAKQRGSGSIWRYLLASAHALATTSSATSAKMQTPQRPFVV